MMGELGEAIKVIVNAEKNVLAGCAAAFYPAFCSPINNLLTSTR